jgi:hypothetical protein
MKSETCAAARKISLEPMDSGMDSEIRVMRVLAGERVEIPISLVAVV